MPNSDEQISATLAQESETAPESGQPPLARPNTRSVPAGEKLPEAAPEQPEQPARKRLFIGLICGTTLLLSLILIIGWGIPYIGFGNIHPSVPYITAAVFLLIIALLLWSSLSLALQVITGRLLWGAGKTRGLTVKLFLPLMELIGRVAGIPPKDVRRSFIEVNNELVGNTAKKRRPEELLLLLPHCIQWSGCNLRVSNRMESCKRCGQCNVGSLLDLTEKYGVHIAVATGGTIARRIVVEKRPKMIIAVACERDLASGIQDTHPLPVYGILNQRPHGPCVDTCVSLQNVEAALKRFIRD